MFTIHRGTKIEYWGTFWRTTDDVRASIVDESSYGNESGSFSGGRKYTIAKGSTVKLIGSKSEKYVKLAGSVNAEQVE